MGVLRGRKVGVKEQDGWPRHASALECIFSFLVS